MSSLCPRFGENPVGLYLSVRVRVNVIFFVVFPFSFFSPSEHINLEHVCFCVCVSSHSFWTSSSLDVPAGVTQEEGHTGFFIHLSVVRALIFLARRIQPFLSLVDREVEFCVLPGNDLIVLHPLGIFSFVF